MVQNEFDAKGRSDRVLAGSGRSCEIVALLRSAIARRYGCRYFRDLEISEAGVIARCCNSLVASTVWQLYQPLIELGDELLVYCLWHHERLDLQ